MLLLKFLQCSTMSERQPNVVQAQQQALATERIGGEGKRETMFIVQLLVFERNRKLITWNGRGTLHQRLHLFLGQSNQQNAVLARVGMKNVGEGRRDHTTKAVVGKSPRGMFARGSTTEVLSRDQNLRILVVRMIQNEIRMRCAGIRPFLNTPPIVEKKIAIAGAFDPLEELLGDDLIGIDILAIEGCDHPRVFAKWLHWRDSTACAGTGLNCHLRTSVKC